MKRLLQITVMVCIILMTIMPEILSAQPQPTVIMNQAYDYDGTWYDVGKTTFEYLPDNQTIQTEYGWVPPAWEVSNRTITTVDEHDNMTEFILEMLLDGTWSPMVHWVYGNTYQNGLLMEVKQGDPELVGMGFWTTREVYTYDAAGKITEIIQQLSIVTSWVNVGRSVYHYQGNNIDYITEETFVEEGSSWSYENKTVHTYSDGKLFSLEEFEWDENSWVPQELYEYYYKGDTSIDYILVKDWDGSYDIQRRFVYFYGEISVDEQSSALPKTFTFSNYPNPFNPVTTIAYELPQTAHVTMVICDITGRKVAELVNQVQPAGVHQVNWDARDQASGIYFCTLRTADGLSHTLKLNLLK